MRKLLLTLLFITAFTTFSCSDNDDKSTEIIPGPPTGTDVRYAVMTSADMITNIQYKNASGSLSTGELLPDSQTAWSMTIIVPFASHPFTSRVQASFVNTTSENQDYTLEIYQDGVLAQTVSGSVGPADNDPLTDDTGTANAEFIIAH